MAPIVRADTAAGTLPEEVAMVVVGLDVDAGSWVGMVLRDGLVADGFLVPTIERAIEREPEAAAFGIDIPIGLLERGFRECDRLAFERIGGSVFMTPPRPVVEAGDRGRAYDLHRELTDKGLSPFAIGLFDKIREVDAYLRAKPETPAFEVHPELSFWRMNGGRRLDGRKRTWRGHLERIDLLAREGIRVPDLPGLAGAGIADVLDAAAAAWSAGRIATGTAESLPEGARGPGAIHY